MIILTPWYHVDEYVLVAQGVRGGNGPAPMYRWYRRCRRGFVYGDVSKRVHGDYYWWVCQGPHKTSTPNHSGNEKTLEAAQSEVDKWLELFGCKFISNKQAALI